MSVLEFENENTKSLIERWTNEAQKDQEMAHFPDL
jgi:hypothetical protein